MKRSLWNGGRAWFTRAARYGDPDTRRAALVTVGGLVLVVIPGYVASSWLLAPEHPFIYAICGAGWLAAIAGLLAALRDRLQLGSTIIATAIWAVVAGLTLHDGADSPHVGAFAPAIVGAGLLVTARVGLVLTLGSALVVLAAYALQVHGYGRPAPPLVPDVVAPIAQLLATGGFVAGLIYAFSRALSQLRAREAELRQSELRYEGLFEQSPDGILLLSEQGELRAMNPAAEALLGTMPPAQPGRSFLSLPFDEASRALVAELAAGKRSSGEVILHFGEQPRVLAINATSLGFEEGGGGVQLTLRDVTQARANEEAQRALEQRLRRSERMEAFGQLAGGVAHDFNNILTGILGHVDLSRRKLQRQQAAPDVLAGLSELERAAERGAAITKQLLLFSRKSNLDAGVADVARSVADSSELLRRLIREDMNLELALEPTGLVAISGSAIEQIVINLVVNARDAMEQGGRIRVRTGTQRVSDAGPPQDGRIGAGLYALLEVSDTGCGIPASHLGRLFDPFFTTKPPGQGTGLGLSTVHGIVRRAGGQVEVSSQVGTGSTFRVLIPQSAQLEAEAPRPRTTPIPPGRQQMILLCEDEPMIREAVSEVLSGHGYQVRATGSPKEALQLAAALGERLALLITDVIMPELNGPQLVAALARTHPRLPVLFISGYTGGLLADLGIGENDTRLLSKPFAPTALLQRVAAILSESTQGSDAPRAPPVVPPSG